MGKCIFAINFFIVDELKYTRPDKGEWVYKTITYRSNIVPACGDEIAKVYFLQDLSKEKFEPMHIVLFSCLIDELRKNGYRVGLNIENEELHDFVWEDIKVEEYWGEHAVCHVPSPVPSRFNIWRIIDKQKDAYAIVVCEYFKKLNRGKDFSGFQTTLNELYYNVFDHAEADGNAFSYIWYDEYKCEISVAICDFGKGIARTLREAHVEYQTDNDALLASIKNGVTARSRSHNAGMGLYNVVEMLQGNDYLRIISNKSLLVCVGKQKKVFNLQKEFCGTLVYLRISMDSFEDEEIVESFEF